jgi:hypothetical protein
VIGGRGKWEGSGLFKAVIREANAEKRDGGGEECYPQVLGSGLTRGSAEPEQADVPGQPLTNAAWRSLAKEWDQKLGRKPTAEDEKKSSHVRPMGEA